MELLIEVRRFLSVGRHRAKLQSEFKFSTGGLTKMYSGTPRFTASLLKYKIILRNVIFLSAMIVFLVASPFKHTHASEIVAGIGCSLIHITPAGGPDGGARCTGYAVCYSELSDSLYFMTGTPVMDAYCVAQPCVNTVWNYTTTVNMADNG